MTRSSISTLSLLFGWPFAPFAFCAFALLCPARLAQCDGLPEPGLLMYGTVVNTLGGGNVRLTSGRLLWTIQPAAGGAAITLTNDLVNINGQFSYLLRVPFETLVGSASATPNTLRLNAGRTGYVRSGVTVRVDGVGTAIPATIVSPALGTFEFGGSDRGRVEQVNLQVAIAVADSDRDGIADAWMLKYFGHPTGQAADRSRAGDDADGDGMTNIEECIAGTDPTDDTSFFAISRLVHDARGTWDAVEWTSASNRLYAVYGAPAISADPGAFSLIASNLVATPPTNTYTNTMAPGARYYRIEVTKPE